MKFVTFFVAVVAASLSLYVSAVECNCHKIVKLQPGQVSKFLYEIQINNNIAGVEYIANVTADIFVRQSEEPDKLEFVFKNFNISSSDTVAKDARAVIRNLYDRNEIYHLQCGPNYNLTLTPKINTKSKSPWDNRSATCKWLGFYYDADVVEALKTGGTELNKSISMNLHTLVETPQDDDDLNDLKLTLNYDNPTAYEVIGVFDNFNSDRTSVKLFEMNTLLDRNDFTLIKRTGNSFVNGSNYHGNSNITVTFDQFIPDVPRLFQFRTLPRPDNERELSEVALMFKHSKGFDSRWKLNLQLHAEFESKRPSIDVKPTEVEILIRTSHDPKYAFFRVLPQTEPIDYDWFNYIGVVFASPDGYLQFDLLGDRRLKSLVPKPLRKFIGNLRLFTDIDINFGPGQFKVETRKDPVNCDEITTNSSFIKHEKEDLEELIIDLSMPNRGCDSDPATYAYNLKSRQMYDLADFTIKQLSLKVEESEKAHHLIQVDADLAFVGFVPVADNNALFTVYDEVLDKNWFD